MSTVSRYELISENKNWTNAQYHCTELGRNLVVILDENEHLALQAYIETVAGLSLCYL